jgi:hypothetical protein
MVDENTKLRAAIERVRALHDPGERGWCCEVYSCPTLRALDGEGA